MLTLGGDLWVPTPLSSSSPPCTLFLALLYLSSSSSPSSNLFRFCPTPPPSTYHIPNAVPERNVPVLGAAVPPAAVQHSYDEVRLDPPDDPAGGARGRGQPADPRPGNQGGLYRELNGLEDGGQKVVYASTA